ncbi:MAG: hypothetical protein IKI74_07265 [Christensenellaceae bacterium]|nr:hypothetical protein [Christensenellaceae bacterium]
MEKHRSVFEKDITIAPSLCDSTAKLSIPGVFSVFMDMAAEHAEEIGCGIGMIKKRGLFWITVRTKILVRKLPDLSSHACAVTWPSVPERFRCMRYYLLKQGEEVLCEGKTEWAVFDMERNRLSRADSVYPEDLVMEEKTACDIPFIRSADDIPPEHEKAVYTVRSTDIDFGGHMNNAAYIKALFSCLSSSERSSINVRSMEAVFRAQTFENEQLSVRMRDDPDGKDVTFVKEDGRTCFIARIDTV